MLFAAVKGVSKWDCIFKRVCGIGCCDCQVGTVIAGTLLSEFINEKYLNYLAGTALSSCAFTLLRAWPPIHMENDEASKRHRRKPLLNRSRQSHCSSQCAIVRLQE